MFDRVKVWVLAGLVFDDLITMQLVERCLDLGNEK
jgi:hypothetical protein